MSTSYRILIADDHVIIRRGLKFILDANFSGSFISEAGTINEIKELLGQYAYTHLILDMQILDMNIMEYLPEIRKSLPLIPILIYTMSSEEIYGKRMLEMGATGFLSKESLEEEVIESLGLFLSGMPYMSVYLKDKIQKESNNKHSSESPIDDLSDRELNVMNYILKGNGVKEIAIKLELKPTTVATYKARIFNKLGVTNVIALKSILDIYRYKTS